MYRRGELPLLKRLAQQDALVALHTMPLQVIGRIARRVDDLEPGTDGQNTLRQLGAARIRHDCQYFASAVMLGQPLGYKYLMYQR